ncbi:single-stranded-DNA-specific exonuclease RecJ [Aestuariibacter sp. AA17]|uniref:Single-stranded-DNA-specific exonuclease RecJ n=1 Tax=Fluctibacter corallii TaxID=2984329 RepID=A0ABT3A4E7_9ALTE|nr:single-stranded-DNA-specific exonuclease RecJ [Aestuariibacter sp. AA17]MCV2883559.1 single-stranded-DNA-specific exonuclease RecJ [Aestuariibacter sp. AA17]
MPLSISRRPKVDDTHLSSVTHATLRQIYASRGISEPSELETGLKGLLHYKSMRGMTEAVLVLERALAQSKRIIIVGDFDADGATSTALVLLSLSKMGSKNHDYLVPNRFDFGYGLSPQIVDVAHQQGADVIITVDNGISCFDGVERAKSLGIDVVITDHHLPSETLPPADAIVNPNQYGCDFASKSIAGVGVAFYLMLALRAGLMERGWFESQQLAVPNLAEFLDIVALGTVADVVKLDDNNRILVHQGLQRIRSGHCRPGIQALLDVAGRKQTQLAASDLGFVLGPRLNAAGRLDDMSMGIECLLSDDVHRVRHIAAQLDSLNRERREIESSMQVEAETSLNTIQFNEHQLPHGIVLYKPDFHQGVIGIVAGRIKEKYYRPTIAFAHQDDDTLKGSARSIPGLHIRDLLEEINTKYPNVIDKFGGHAMAAGLSLPLSHLDEFQRAFTECAEANLRGKNLENVYITDGELALNDFNLQFAKLLKDAGPWGQGYEEPCFDGEFALLEQRIVGQKHLKMMLSTPTGQLVDAIAFNVDTAIWPQASVKRIRAVYKLDINEFRGKVSLQLLVEGLEPLN